jgi:cyclopropane fatty-acyl-phospholipid synthase-like methyltransferase
MISQLRARTRQPDSLWQGYHDMLNGALYSCVLTLSLTLLSSGFAQGQQNNRKRGFFDYDPLTYVPSPDEVIDKMFEMAKVTKNDTIFDLGCGDGRILYTAAKKFGCRGIGLEVNPVRIREAMDQAERYKVGTLVEIRHADALKVKDLSDASVVVLYMWPVFMDKWFPIAEKTLKPGTRIVVHDYPWTDEVNGWNPIATARVKTPWRDNHKVFLFVVPEKKMKSN